MNADTRLSILNLEHRIRMLAIRANALERRINILNTYIEQRLRLLDKAVVSLRVIVFGVLKAVGVAGAIGLFFLLSRR